jgi:hypothetical protein
MRHLCRVANNSAFRAAERNIDYAHFQVIHAAERAHFVERYIGNNESALCRPRAKLCCTRNPSNTWMRPSPCALECRPSARDSARASPRTDPDPLQQLGRAVKARHHRLKGVRFFYLFDIVN